MSLHKSNIVNVILRKTKGIVNTLTMSHTRKNRTEEIQAVSEGITLPEVPYYPTPTGGRIIYFLEDGSTRQMVIAGELDAAILLKRHNLISMYIPYKDGSVKMFKSFDLNCDRSNNVWLSPRVVHWHDFEFTRAQIILFAAVNELESKEKEYGLEKEHGIVIPLFEEINKAA